MGRWRTVGRMGRLVVVLIAVAGTLGAAQATRAQDSGRTEPWHAVVEAERVNIHSGRAEQFERIGTLSRGDVVLVKSVNTFGWAAIAPPPGLHGFVARQDVADGAMAGSVRAIGRAPVLYPISEDPAQCFRKYRVAADTVLKVLAEVPTPDKGVFLKIELPEQVDVYVLAQFIRKATDEEVAAWKKKIADAAKAAAAEAPKSTPLIPIEAPPHEPQVQPSTPPAESPAAPAEEPAPAETEPAAEPPAQASPAEQPPQEAAPADGQPVDGETQPAEAPAPQPEPPVEITLKGLEQLYGELIRVPIAEAEIEPLLRSYESLAATTAKESERRVAEIRIALLKVRMDHQAAMRKLADAARAAAEPSAPRRAEVWRDEQGRPVFTAQGLLIASNVFDGRRLPLLYRVQDRITGRTVAYLRAEGEQRLELERRLNLNVGVLGEKVHDPGLRLDVIEVERIIDLDEGE